MMSGTQSQLSFKCLLRLVFTAMALAAGLCPAGADQAPKLGVLNTNHQALLYWPGNATNYVLQYCTNLASPSWAYVVDAKKAVYGGQLAMTVTNVAGPRFFRLMQIFAAPPKTPPDKMATITNGVFTMGDTLDGIADAAPVSVNVSTFYMDTNLVTYSQWQQVYSWAVMLGADFDNMGSGKGPNYPVEAVDWFDCATFCNARSLMERLTPVYYWDAEFTRIYTGGIGVVYANWATNGYRLPTEAEWEKAARGGYEQLRFPWGPQISESDANYISAPGSAYPYDLGPAGYNPLGQVGGVPYTSPVGSFPPNGYGLKDMAGNVAEWCWDNYATSYAGGTDPHGPPDGNARVLRGGSNATYADRCRCASRGGNYPVRGDELVGFRCVRGH
jgi:formylglycine-generating enzyme